jgi:hypothetical protein
MFGIVEATLRDVLADRAVEARPKGARQLPNRQVAQVGELGERGCFA